MKKAFEREYSLFTKLEDCADQSESALSDGTDEFTPPSPGLDVPIETLFAESSLKKICAAFGRSPMTLDRFARMLRLVLRLDADYASYCVPILFNAIDTYRRGKIFFTDLCEYLYEDYQRRDTRLGELERLNVVVPGRLILPKVHRPLPVKMIELDDIHLLFSKDGTVSYWSNSFKMRKCRSVKTREIEKERQYGKVYCDMAVVESIGKALVSTSDKEIQFFDLQTLEPYCQIQSLPSCACSLDARMSTRNMLIITFGDWHGAVNVLAMANAGQTLRNWSERPKAMGIAATTFEAALARREIAVVRWKVHERRVDKVIFTELLGGQVISCSTDPNAALSLGCAFPHSAEQAAGQVSLTAVPRRPAGEEQIYKIPFGIQTIDIWEEKRFLAASGVDRVIRVWNIMTRGEPVCTLHGHVAPVRQIQFFPPVLVSISSQKSIRIWELKEFRCIITVNNVVSKIRGQDVLFMHCSKISSAVVVQTSEDLYALQFRRKVGDDESEATHSGPVVCGRYSDLVNVWITCSNAAVKIWDVRTGRKKSEFAVSAPSSDAGEGRINEELRLRAHEVAKRSADASGQGPARWKKNFVPVRNKYYPDLNKPNDVTCACVEAAGNRLLTGHANGIIQEFNFVSGMRIKTMCKPQKTKEGIFHSVVNGVIYVKSALNDNILSVGWGNVVDVYSGGDSETSEPITSWNCFKGHGDDIWCVTSAEPNLLATGSFDGLVILWNFTSGKIEGRLLPPNFEDSPENDSNKVTALSVYRERTDGEVNMEVTYLFSAGPGSGMHMWEIYWKTKSFYYRGRVRPWKHNTRFFTSLATTVEQKAVVAADNVGRVHVFGMSNVEPLKGLRYNQRGFEFNSHLKQLLPEQLHEVELPPAGVTTAAMPELRLAWRAHAKGITVLTICDAHGLLLTGDADGKARIWNLRGQYVGMLGQHKEWDIRNPQTYAYPDGPEDVRGAPESDADENSDEKEDRSRFDGITQTASSRLVEAFDVCNLTNDQITEKAKDMTVYQKVLPEFLKFENCHKVVYRSSLFQQKYSLTPVFKRTFDNELLKSLPKNNEE